MNLHKSRGIKGEGFIFKLSSLHLKSNKREVWLDLRFLIIWLKYFGLAQTLQVHLWWTQDFRWVGFDTVPLFLHCSLSQNTFWMMFSLFAYVIFLQQPIFKGMFTQKFELCYLLTLKLFQTYEVLFFCWAPKKIFWRILAVAIDFHSKKEKYYGWTK